MAATFSNPSIWRKKASNTLVLGDQLFSSYNTDADTNTDIYVEAQHFKYYNYLKKPLQ
jgi:hypothetical protein